MEALEGSTQYYSTKHGNRHYMRYNITLAKISRQHQKVLSRILIYIHILKSDMPINPPLTSNKSSLRLHTSLKRQFPSLPLIPYQLSVHRLHKVIEVVQRLKTGQDALNTSRIRLPILHSHQLPALPAVFQLQAPEPAPQTSTVTTQSEVVQPTTSPPPPLSC